MLRITVYYYQTNAGRCPFKDWFNSLDVKIQQIIDARLTRIRRGLFGHAETLGGLYKEDKKMKPAISYREDLLRRLKYPKYAAGYLNACLEKGDDGDFLLAVRDVAQVHGGLRQLAKDAGLNREHLFRMLSKNGNPQLHSLRQVMEALGFKLVLQRA